MTNFITEQPLAISYLNKIMKLHIKPIKTST
jgi:hypothetical protein